MAQLTEPSELPLTGDGPVPGRKPMPFYPDFALLEAITALCFLVVLVIIAALTEPSLEERADPTASGYVPRPEWYFLWAFQMLKYFPGKTEVLGTFVIPAVLIGLLVGLPFIDRRARPRALIRGTRPVRLWPRLVALAAMAGLGTLTWLAFTAAVPMTREGTHLTAAEAAGQSIYERFGCSTCHTISDVGGDRGPALTSFGIKPDAQERVLLHFTGIGGPPESTMPGYQLSEAELRSLAAYLLSLDGDEGA